MAIRDTLKTLLDGVSSAPHSYQPSTYTFAELNADKMKAVLKPELRGEERGKRNEPSEDSETPDEVEAEIFKSVEQERKQAYLAAMDRMDTYQQRLAALDFEGRFSVIRSASVQAVADFKVEALQGRDLLHEKRRDLLELENELVQFKKHHKLIRSAHYSQGAKLWLKIGLLGLLILIELIVNSAFLAKGSEQGLLEGFAKATTFAALNILATALIAYIGIRYILHRNLVAKVYGLICAIIYVVLAVSLNLALAHYRELSVAQVENAGQLIVQKLMTQPLGFSDINSWIFFGIGLLFSIVALVDVLAIDDSYPGYGKIDRRLRSARRLYREWKENLIGELDAIKEDAQDALNRASYDLGVRKSEYDAILDGQTNLQNQYQQHVGHLEQLGNELLLSYREANKRARSDPEPGYFSKHRYSIVRSLARENQAARGRLENLDELIRHARESLEGQMQAIYAQYQAAVEYYYQLDDLVGEEGPDVKKAA